MKQLATLVLVLTALAVSGASYYIDFTSGSDTNNGTAKGTPWQRHPYMKGATNSYSHVAGDQFIFKGGVTWDSTCFIMAQTNGGTVGSPDYYGVDKTWYSGGSWTRPVFSCGGNALGTNGANIQVKLNCANTILDDIEFTGFYWTSTNGTYQTGIIHIWNTNIVVQNCYIHGWTHASAASGTANDLQCIRLWENGADATGTFTGPGTTGRGNVVSNYVCNGPGPADSSGLALGGILPELTVACSFSNVSTSILWGSATNSGVVYRVSSNVFAHLPGLGFDGGHPNVAEEVGYPYGTNIWDHNIVRDTYPSDTSVMVFYWGGGNYPNGWQSTPTVIAYDNVFWNLGRSCFEFGKLGPVVARLYNNTCYGNSGVASIKAAVGTNVFTLYATNNHFITDYSPPISGIDVLYDGNNLTQTVAAAVAAGYTTNNAMAPTSASSPTVNAGVPTPYTTDVLGITRPQGAAWDIGAYEFVSPATPSTPGAPPWGLMIMQFFRTNAPGALLAVFFPDLTKTQTARLEWNPTTLLASNWTNIGSFMLSQ